MDTTITEQFTGNAPIIKFKAHRAINASGMPWQQRYVLFQFWDLADARTGVIFKSYSFGGLHTIMGMSERAIQGWVKKSEDEGWLEVTRPKDADAIAKHEKNRYRCLLPGITGNHAVANAAPGQISHEDKTPGRAVAFAAPVQQMPTSQEKTITGNPHHALTGHDEIMPSPAPQVPASQDGSGENTRKGDPFCRFCGEGWTYCQDVKTCDKPSPWCETCQYGDKVMIGFTGHGKMYSWCERCDPDVPRQEDEKYEREVKQRKAAYRG